MGVHQTFFFVPGQSPSPHTHTHTTSRIDVLPRLARRNECAAVVASAFEIARRCVGTKRIRAHLPGLGNVRSGAGRSFALYGRGSGTVRAPAGGGGGSSPVRLEEDDASAHSVRQHHRSQRLGRRGKVGRAFLTQNRGRIRTPPPERNRHGGRNGRDRLRGVRKGREPLPSEAFQELPLFFLLSPTGGAGGSVRWRMERHHVRTLPSQHPPRGGGVRLLGAEGRRKMKPTREGTRVSLSLSLHSRLAASHSRNTG